ncbi:uncharacterized protein BXZ73DRAFT_95586 [Epithele typhae]|uniref:uncharacterized protein n=1 Tax=Epithele typhae TaxID=378194 RepID=UPI002007B1DB|nr:uncharacterized protein BXZ73DRAFT_95586 [Epithele typhae]KAH9946081.1 hypothetical protein BXZ73DRAFT_95586 [Epithele typhae]
MHRAALRVPLRNAASSHRRGFVSTVLLTKAWENETVAELKKEAKNRGLSPSGNKATLVTRLKQYDYRSVMASEPSPSPMSSQVRYASAAGPLETPTEFTMDIKIPDTAVPEPEIPMQIPLLPDSWNSHNLNDSSSLPSTPSSDPKVVVVGGAETHPGGGPTHNVYVPSSTVSSPSTPPPTFDAQLLRQPSTQLGHVMAGMAEDLGVPRSIKLPSIKIELGGAPSGPNSSRPLNSDEQRGAWSLLALLAGSWVAGGIFAPSAEYAHEDAHGH